MANYDNIHKQINKLFKQIKIVKEAFQREHQEEIMEEHLAMSCSNGDRHSPLITGLTSALFLPIIWHTINISVDKYSRNKRYKEYKRQLENFRDNLNKLSRKEQVGENGFTAFINDIKNKSPEVMRRRIAARLRITFW